MIDVVQAASYIYQRYFDKYNRIIDEMKLHKLLYFCQRESFIIFGQPMFEEQFAAWKYGPVLLRIRDCYRNKSFNYVLDEDDLKKYLPVFDYVLDNYAPKSSWSLSMLSHGESSWENARKRMQEEGISTAFMSNEDIKADAERMKFRRFYFNEILPQISSSQKMV